MSRLIHLPGFSRKPSGIVPTPKGFRLSGVVNIYGYRYFHPNLGRWLSRDPIGEQGGLNLYTFVGNNAQSKFDLFGMTEAGCGEKCCCCVESVGKGTLTPVNGSDIPNHRRGGTQDPAFQGHKWEIPVLLSQKNKLSNESDNLGCSLEWWEKENDGPWIHTNSEKEKNRAPQPKKNDPGFLYYTFPWNTWYPNKDKSTPFNVIDYPALMPQRPNENQDRSNHRILSIKAVFKSSPDCDCKTKELPVYFTQEINFDKEGTRTQFTANSYDSRPENFPK